MRQEVFSLLLVTSFGSLSAAAQQLLPNPDFDTGIDGWGLDESTGQQWSAEDSEGRAGSGSLAAGSVETSPGIDYFSTRTPPNHEPCIAVAAGETIYAEITYRSEASITRLYFHYYADPTCSLSYTFSPYIAWDVPATQWHTIRGSALVPLAGVGAFRLAVNATGSAPFSMSLDRAYAGHTPRLLSDGFERGWTREWTETTP